MRSISRSAQRNVDIGNGSKIDQSALSGSERKYLDIAKPLSSTFLQAHANVIATSISLKRTCIASANQRSRCGGQAARRNPEIGGPVAVEDDLQFRPAT